MDAHILYNKRKLCYTEIYDYTDYQGIGDDPLYRRYDSVFSVVKSNIDEEYYHFLAHPLYIKENDRIEWHVSDWKEQPVRYVELEGAEKEKYRVIKDKTIAHYRERLTRANGEDLLILACALKYISEEAIYCFDDKVVVVTWGMTLDTKRHQTVGTAIHDYYLNKLLTLTFDCGNNGVFNSSDDATIKKREGSVLSAEDMPKVLPYDGYRLERWEPDLLGQEVNSDLTFVAVYQEVKLDENNTPVDKVKVTFMSDKCGFLNGNLSHTVEAGSILSNNQIPEVLPTNGKVFTGWTPSVHVPVVGDTTFFANYDDELYTCNFISGEHGSIEGNDKAQKLHGSMLLEGDIPTVQPKKGYRFTGWDADVEKLAVTKNTTFTARYEPCMPWYKKFWLWLKSLFSKRLLKYLLILLLVLFLLWLFSFLFTDCSGGNIFSSNKDRFGNRLLNDHSIEVIDQERGVDGSLRDRNGRIGNIVDESGRLPINGITPPMTDDLGMLPPIIHNDGAPDLVANRLNIYFSDDNADLDLWIKKFKQAYPGDEYIIIGHDRNVRMIQIQIPEDARNSVRNEINSKISGDEFFVVDESILSIRKSSLISTQSGNSNKGWHLDATNVREAWNITTGNPEVVVAIVDDGIDTNHPIFGNRFYKSYNVFTQNRALSIGDGHGTHVAALAAGTAEFVNNGVAGVAPKCRIMPVQVFDNGVCTFSSLASGLMYAIHNGADVVNVSIAPSFKGLSELSLPEQRAVAETLFKNEEKVYRHIINTANKKGVIIVFAAGNDNIISSVLPECRVENKTVNVAAIDPNNKSTGFTNYSSGTNISAPGLDIYSAMPNNYYDIQSGTSMAAPIVTGAIALMKSLEPNITVEQAISVMQHTGLSTDEYVPQTLLIDKALEMVLSGNIPPISSGSNSGSNNHIAPIDGVQPGHEDNQNDRGSPSVGGVISGGTPNAGGNNDSGRNNPDVNSGNNNPVDGSGRGHQPIDEPNAGTQDDYSELKKRLDHLRRERDELDMKIKQLENEIK